MDILAPPIIKIGRKLYRKNPSRGAQSQMIPVGHLEEEFQNTELPDDTEHETDKTCFLVGAIKCDSGAFTAKLYVPPVFYKVIIGLRHSKQYEIEKQFSCKLKIPGPSSTDNHVIIHAQSETIIYRIVQRIAFIVNESRTSMRPTHFVCLPLLNASLKETYCAFMRDIVERCDKDQERAFRGVDADLFVSEHKLHFTMVTLMLADQREVNLAAKLLNEFFQETEEGRAFEKKPLRLTICGFACMNDDPRSANVLYATLHENAESRRLQSIANGIADLYTRHGLCSGGQRRLGDPVKLHMTILNSRLRAERLTRATVATSDLSVPSKVEPFSAVGIFSKYEGTCLIKDGEFGEIQLCKMFPDGGDEKDTTSTFYPCEAKLCWTD